MPSATDPLTNNSVPIQRISVNVDKDVEYETIEVEEEIKNGEENSAGLARLREEDHKKDGIHILKPMDYEKHLRSGISTPKQPVAKPDSPMIEEGKRTDSDLQALRCYSGETITHEIQPFGPRVSAEFTEGGHQEVSHDLQKTSSRLDVQETRERSLSPAAGSSGGNKGAVDRCEFYSRGWCINGSSCRFLHVRDPVISHDKDGILDAAKMKSKVINGEGSKYTTERPAPDCFSGLASSEVQCGVNQRLNSDNDSHMHKDEDRSHMPFRDIGRETLECVDDTSYKRTQPMLDYHCLPFLNRSVDRLPPYLTSSSSNLYPAGDQKLLDHTQEYCSSRSISLHNKSSALPGCGTEPFSWTDISGDMDHSSGNKTKVYFDDWEPSAPFRPSTFLSQIIPPPESLYDPIRDSIEQPKTAQKDVSAYERITADIIIAHQENMNTSSKEERHSRPVNVRAQKRKQSKLEKLRSSCEIDTEFRRDGSVNYESGYMKQFRVALVDFVKELLKPTWHEGLLMRDAYKMIVKKAVDKIINSLTLDQIPDTTESINQCLSVSKPKVAKLIEGYVEKYGKS